MSPLMFALHDDAAPSQAVLAEDVDFLPLLAVGDDDEEEWDEEEDWDDEDEDWDEDDDWDDDDWDDDDEEDEEEGWEEEEE